MANAHIWREHSAMAKTEDPSATTSTARILRRRVSDRVIGGVAGGLGDYFEIDPLLLRIAFVGLMIFGGAGLVLYVIAWLLIPGDGHDRSVASRQPEEECSLSFSDDLKGACHAVISPCSCIIASTRWLTECDHITISGHAPQRVPLKGVCFESR